MGALAVAFVAGAAVAVLAGVWSARVKIFGTWLRLAPDMSAVTARRERRPTPGGGFRASILMSLDAPAGMESAQGVQRELADELRGYLGDVAAQHGADLAMLWLRVTERASFESMAWNHSGAPDANVWGSEQQRALVAWAAGEGVVTFDTADSAPTLAASRVDLDAVPALGSAAQAGGALVLHAAGGIRGSRDDLRLWLPRHAQRLAQLVELQVTRNEVARANRQLRVLTRNAQEMQATGEQETLERGIADSVVEASGADFAALVAWDPELRRGALRRVTTRYPAPVPPANQPVEEGSLVGSVCLDGTPRLWENARTVVGVEPLFAAASLVPSMGTLAILALQRGGHTLGALVIGAREPGVIRPNGLRISKLIAQLAASALEAAWEIEEVSERSLTDQLTRLWNRRHFDEQLARVLSEADRYGRSCAIVLADVDRFKQVNDSYGHESGDDVLKMVAGVLRQVARTTDICARIGGEEFCVIVPQTTLAGAMELAERIRSKLDATSVSSRGQELRVTASFGVATYTAGAIGEKGQLFAAADRALYLAKAEGRNRVKTL